MVSRRQSICDVKISVGRGPSYLWQTVFRRLHLWYCVTKEESLKFQNLVWRRVWTAPKYKYLEHFIRFFWISRRTEVFPLNNLKFLKIKFIHKFLNLENRFACQRHKIFLFNQCFCLSFQFPFAFHCQWHYYFYREWKFL